MINQYRVLFFVSIFFVAFYNFAFFSNIALAYDLSQTNNLCFFLCIIAFLCFFIFFLLSLIAYKFSTKFSLIILFLISSGVAYFQDTYNVIINDEMIRNILQTNPNESLELFSFKLVIYVVLLGILPSIFIYKLPISYEKPIRFKLKSLIISFSILTILALSFSKFFASFFREHKPLRYYTNPTYWIYSSVKFGINLASNKQNTFQILTQNPTLNQRDKNSLVFMVVGETARADRFSLNGYTKKTNPLLEKKAILNFPNMYSCGTSTAISVPCMFSYFTKDDYDDQKAYYTQNVLDILSKAGVKVLWIDNNSDSKGVALRVDYKKITCNAKECKDEDMLKDLDTFIKAHESKNVLIVFHQMGNHGPSYHKRYPKEFEKFKPVCKTNQLENCTKEEVSNAYDNALLYTDYFLSKSIDFLSTYKNKFSTSLFYVSDHGESLGEKGLYLHGLPYFMAPEEQTHVASFMWFSDDRYKDINTDKKYTHDYVFSTILGLFDVKTKLYDANLDILRQKK